MLHCCEKVARTDSGRSCHHRSLASITPINLFSLGLLLHYHSTPYHDPVVPPSRPVYFLILLQLGEILTLQIAAIPAWRIRLWITASFALVSRSAMVYFYMTTTEKGELPLFLYFAQL